MKLLSLTNGGFAKVDDEDFGRVSKIEWYRDSRGYIAAVRGDGKGRSLLLHRLIMDPLYGMEVDHRNHDTLDYQRENLRLCTKSQNQMNRVVSITYAGKPKSSKYKGVTWHKKNRRWIAQIGVDDRRIYLGTFGTELEAALAYNKAALFYFGEFAYLNKIEEEQSHAIPSKR